MNTGVIGCGYVGLVLAAGFAEPGHNDAESDAARLELLEKGKSGFHERHLSELLRKHAGARLQFRQSIEETVQHVKVVFICGGTPSLRSGEGDLLDAGIGFGGPCFPKDLHAFRALSRREGYRFDLLSEVIRINRGQRFRFLEKVRMALSPLSGKRIAVLGLSFKARGDDIGQSPAVEIVWHLVRSGRNDSGAKGILRDRSGFCRRFLCGDEGRRRLLILTEWPEFAALDLQCVRNLLRTPIVLDRRNLYSPCQTKVVGLNYISVGRPSRWPVPAQQNLSRSLHRQTTISGLRTRGPHSVQPRNN